MDNTYASTSINSRNTMNVLLDGSSANDDNTSAGQSLEEILCAALEVCEEETKHNTPKKKQTQHIKRKPFVSAPVAVPRPRSALHDQLSSHPIDTTVDCSESPTSKYNYDLATWRMYNRITTARARRSTLTDDPCQAGIVGQHPSIYKQVSPITVGMATPQAVPHHDTGMDYDGDVFSLDF